MKFSCDKELLFKSIETVSKALLPNNPVDILKGMKISILKREKRRIIFRKVLP